MKHVVCLVLSSFALLAAQQSVRFTVSFDTIPYTISHESGYVRISTPDGALCGTPGDPELPAYFFTYLLPYCTRAKRIEMQHVSWEDCAQNVEIFPRQIDYPLYAKELHQENTQPTYYDLDVYPAVPITTWTNGNMRGFSCIQLSVVPFKYYPDEKQLLHLRSLVIEVVLEPRTPQTKPFVQSSRSKVITYQVAAASVQNTYMIDHPAYTPPCMITDQFRFQDSLSMPSRDTAPVDFLIITCDDFYEVYRDYERMSRLLGYNTAIRTITWIRQHFDGVDDAERIRSCIRLAVNEWGVSYVLLGGDTPVIPTRWVHMEPLYDRWPVHIVTDLYFADLDGNWNFDNDSKFGEISDSLDLFPDVFVGRLPARSSSDVRAYLEKYTAYLTSPPWSGCARALFITSDFEVANDAYNMAKRLAQHLPSHFDTVFLNERPLQEVVDSIQRGFNFVAGLGHGDNNNLRIRNNPRENAYNFVFDSLYNTHVSGIMPVITCYTNTIQTDCLGEHWILNPQGGGVTYVGPTCCSEAYLHEEFTRELLDSLFNMPVGAAHALCKVPFISQSQWDNWYRLYQFAIVMLGDPSIRLWDSIPNNWGLVNVTKDTLFCGLDSITVYCAPAVPYRAVFLKDNELYIRDSTMNGVLQIELNTETPGYIHYMVYADDYIPHYGSLYVQPGEPRLLIDHYFISDSAGNNNGVINPQETLAVWLYVKNSGSDIATHVSGRINCNDANVIVMNDSSSYPDIAGNAIQKNMTPFTLYTADSIPDLQMFKIELDVMFQSAQSVVHHNIIDSVHMVCSSPTLEHFSQKIYENIARDTAVYNISVEIRNTGHAPALNITGIIRALNDSVSILDSIIYIPYVPANMVVSSGSDVFTVQRADSSTPIIYEYALFMNNTLVDTFQVRIDTPSVATQLQSIPYDDVLQVTWQPVSGVSGYRVLRSLAPDTGFMRLTDDVVPVCLYADYTVGQGREYFYRVIAVDQWMNHGPVSASTSSSLSPPHAPGWPQPVYDYLFSSSTVGDLDPFYPGYEIIVCGKDGRVYAWHYDGSPVGDEAVLFDISPTQVWTSPAIGDLNNDGTYELVFGVRRSTDNLYIINRYGQSMYGWPITVPGQLIGSPVLADLDQNGDLEIIVWTVQADVYVFDHRGHGFFTPTGLLKDLPGMGFGTVSVGDIDQDGFLEIVCAGGSSGDSLYVWDHQGQPKTPFPVYVQSGGLTYSTVLGDICGDNQLEILFYADNSERVYAVDANASIMWFSLLDNVAAIEGSPVLGDITGDGYPEILCGYPTGFTIFDSLGNTLAGFPDTMHDGNLVVVSDLDIDGVCDAIVGSVDWNLYAYTHTAEQIPGFPVFFNNRIESSPAVYDIDNDGCLELMVGGSGLLFHVFDLPAITFEWPMFRYDQYNSGTYLSGNLLSLAISRTADIMGSPHVSVVPTVFSKKLYVLIPFECMSTNTEEQQLTVYDICGRRITSFNIPCRFPYVDMVWDGYDEDGDLIAAGVYFITFTSGDCTYTTKVIKVK